MAYIGRDKTQMYVYYFDFPLDGLVWFDSFHQDTYTEPSKSTKLFLVGVEGYVCLENVPTLSGFIYNGNLVNEYKK